MLESYAQLAGWLSFSLVSLSEILYVRAIFRGTTRPSRSTFWVWTLVQALSAASYFASGGGAAALLPLSYAIWFFVIAVLSVRYGDHAWTRLDTGVLVGAFVSAGAWWASGSSELGLIFLMLTDFAGAIPTILKSRHCPEHEDRTAWILTLVANLVDLPAVGARTVLNLVYPLYLFAVNSTIVYFLVQPRKS